MTLRELKQRVDILAESVPGNTEIVLEDGRKLVGVYQTTPPRSGNAIALFGEAFVINVFLNRRDLDGK